MPDRRDPVLRPDLPDRREELHEGGYAPIDSHVTDDAEATYGEPGGPRPPHFTRVPAGDVAPSHRTTADANPPQGRYGGPQDVGRKGFFGGTGDPPAAPEKDDPALDDSV